MQTGNLDALKSVMSNQESMEFVASDETKKSPRNMKKFIASTLGMMAYATSIVASTVTLATMAGVGGYALYQNVLKDQLFPKEIVQVQVEQHDFENETDLSFQDILTLSNGVPVAVIEPNAVPVSIDFATQKAELIVNAENEELGLISQEILNENAEDSNRFVTRIADANNSLMENGKWIDANAYVNHSTESCVISMPDENSMFDLVRYFMKRDINLQMQDDFKNYISDDTSGFTKKISTFILAHEAAHCGQEQMSLEDLPESIMEESIVTLNNEINADQQASMFVDGLYGPDDKLSEFFYGSRVATSIYNMSNHVAFSDENEFTRFTHATGYDALNGQEFASASNELVTKLKQDGNNLIFKEQVGQRLDSGEGYDESKEMGTFMTYAIAAALDDDVSPEVRQLVSSWGSALDVFQIDFGDDHSIKIRQSSSGNTTITFHDASGKINSLAEGAPAMVIIDSEGHIIKEAAMDHGRVAQLNPDISLFESMVSAEKDRIYEDHKEFCDQEKYPLTYRTYQEICK